MNDFSSSRNNKFRKFSRRIESGSYCSFLLKLTNFHIHWTRSHPGLYTFLNYLLVRSAQFGAFRLMLLRSKIARCRLILTRDSHVGGTGISRPNKCARTSACKTLWFTISILAGSRTFFPFSGFLESHEGVSYELTSGIIHPNLWKIVKFPHFSHISTGHFGELYVRNICVCQINVLIK